MSVRKLSLVIFGMLLLFMFAISGSASAFTLNLKQGDKYITQVTAEETVFLTVKNQQVKTTQTKVINLTTEVKEVDKAKNTTLYTQYDSIKIAGNFAGKNLTIDSAKDDPGKSPLTALYKGLIGKGFTIKIASKGQVLSVQGLDSLIDSIVNNLPINEQQKKVYKNQLVKPLSDSVINTLTNQSAAFNPPANLKTGDTWDNKIDITALFPMSMAAKYKLISDQNGMLSIDLKTNIETTEAKGPVDFMGLKANIKLFGAGTGNFLLDKNSGISPKVILTQSISGEIELLASEAMPNNITIPMQMTSKITAITTKK